MRNRFTLAHLVLAAATIAAIPACFVDDSSDLGAAEDTLSSPERSFSMKRVEIKHDGPPTMTVVEGGVMAFSVWPASPPTTPLLVKLVSLDPSVATVSPSTLVFGPGDAGHRTVVVAGTPDTNLTPNTTSVRIIGPSGTTEIPISVLDDDTQAILLGPSSVAIPEGSQRTLTVRLAFDPGMPVTVSLASSDSTAVVATPATLQFTSADYALPVTATLDALVDADTISETATITASGAAAPATTFVANVIDQTQIVAYGWTAPLEGSALMHDGTAIAYRILVPSATTLDALGMLAKTTAGTYRMALYADDPVGLPGTLIGVSGRDARAAIAGSNVIDVVPAILLAAGYYWIALRGDGLHVGADAGGLPPSRACRSSMIEMAEPWPDRWSSSLPDTSCDQLPPRNLWITTHRQWSGGPPP